MGGRKWQDLNMDCLVNVFGRVGLESLLCDVPFVCKSWYKATLNPQCWQCLIFLDNFPVRCANEYTLKARSNAKQLIELVVSQSQKSATTLALPFYCTEEELICVAEE